MFLPFIIFSKGGFIIKESGFLLPLSPSGTLLWPPRRRWYIFHWGNVLLTSMHVMRVELLLTLDLIQLRLWTVDLNFPLILTFFIPLHNTPPNYHAVYPSRSSFRRRSTWSSSHTVDSIHHLTITFIFCCHLIFNLVRNIFWLIT